TRLVRWLAAPLLVAGLVTVAPAQAAAAFSSTMVNQASSTCATVPNGNSAVQLTRSTCNSSAGQTFSFTLVSGDVDSIGTFTSGSCLDIYGASTADNAAVIQYACHSGTNQQFRLTSLGSNMFSVVAVHSGKCVAGDATALTQLPCNTSTARVWRIPGF